MTYCVGMLLERGLVFMSDTRSNGGIDNVTSFKKNYSWKIGDEGIVTLLCSGNLATTQAVVSTLNESVSGLSNQQYALDKCKTMFQVAKIVSKILLDVISEVCVLPSSEKNTFNASLILGGQIKGEQPRLFLIYPEGNFIEASDTTPFFQVGETKYGRPILLRGYDLRMSFEKAIKLLAVSFDSTMKTNLSVSPPFDFRLYERDSIALGPSGRILEDDPYLRIISEGWGEALKSALDKLPDFRI